MKCSLYENKLSLFINVFSLIQKRSKKGLWWKKLITGNGEDFLEVLDVDWGLLWRTFRRFLCSIEPWRDFRRILRKLLIFRRISGRILWLWWGYKTFQKNHEDFEAVSISFKGTLDLLDNIFHLEDFKIREIQRYLNFSFFKNFLTVPKTHKFTKLFQSFHCTKTKRHVKLYCLHIR